MVFVSDVGVTVADICIMAACCATSGGRTFTMSIGTASGTYDLLRWLTM